MIFLRRWKSALLLRTFWFKVNRIIREESDGQNCMCVIGMMRFFLSLVSNGFIANGCKPCTANPETFLRAFV
ncbi:hypothetical protein D4L85_33550 [Chryseolinea soli]|uniref:Uncharacterized protein n=1 Tax=Chryseolinea soli TaxID=2321403 RepID=A0A385SWJ4_9BACT|nr:hypothetical protein D4L85_33550 [Chryseolinea soli]